MNDEFSAIENKIKRALEALIEKDGFLIDNNTNDLYSLSWIIHHQDTERSETS